MAIRKMRYDEDSVYFLVKIMQSLQEESALLVLRILMQANLSV